MDKFKSGFQIKNLLLIESSFWRINAVKFDKDVKNDLNIETGVSVKDNSVIVEEIVTLTQVFERVEQVKMKIKMIGVFERVGESSLMDLEQFGKINGAAIIYPYIREHITTLALKAGLGNILLPPVNFTQNE